MVSQITDYYYFLLFILQQRSMSINRWGWQSFFNPYLPFFSINKTPVHRLIVLRLFTQSQYNAQYNWYNCKAAQSWVLRDVFSVLSIPVTQLRPRSKFSYYRSERTPPSNWMELLSRNVSAIVNEYFMWITSRATSSTRNFLLQLLEVRNFIS
jgi:hypothetical protein